MRAEAVRVAERYPTLIITCALDRQKTLHSADSLVPASDRIRHELVLGLPCLSHIDHS